MHHPNHATPVIVCSACSTANIYAKLLRCASVMCRKGLKVYVVSCFCSPPLSSISAICSMKIDCTKAPPDLDSRATTCAIVLNKHNNCFEESHSSTCLQRCSTLSKSPMTEMPEWSCGGNVSIMASTQCAWVNTKLHVLTVTRCSAAQVSYMPSGCPNLDIRMPQARCSQRQKVQGPGQLHEGVPTYKGGAHPVVSPVASKRTRIVPAVCAVSPQDLEVTHNL